MDDNIKRRLDAELKNLALGSVFSVQDFSVALSKKQLLSFLSPYLDQGEVSQVIPNIYYKVKFSNLFNPPRAFGSITEAQEAHWNAEIEPLM
jgi:hypothetical protein